MSVQMLSVAQLAGYLRVTKRTVQRKAVRQRWPYTEQKGLGGSSRMYSFATLSNDIKAKIIAAIIGGQERLTSQAGITVGLISGSAPVTSIVLSPPLDPKFIDKTCIKLSLLVMARQHTRHTNQGKIKGIDSFCLLYNARQLDIDDAVYGVVKHISRITLLRWEKAETTLLWSEAYGSEDDQETQVFNELLKNIAKEVLLVSPDISTQHLRLHFLTFFAHQPIPAEAQITQWLHDYKAWCLR